MLEKIKDMVCTANLMLPENRLVKLTWGNVSQIDRESGYVVIKPSGVKYSDLTPCKMVVVDLDGNKVEGELNPSSDTYTHLELYKQYPGIGGITHTHSKWATVFAQSGKPIPAMGTTHADTFYGEIPCTREMTRDEIGRNYELETGRVITELFDNRKAAEIPGVLVHSHGAFTWGRDAVQSVEHAIILEEVADMAYHTMLISGDSRISQELLDKHFLRKHGANAYYGQKGE